MARTSASNGAVAQDRLRRQRVGARRGLDALGVLPAAVLCHRDGANVRPNLGGELARPLGLLEGRRVFLGCAAGERVVAEETSLSVRGLSSVSRATASAAVAQLGGERRVGRDRLRDAPPGRRVDCHLSDQLLRALPERRVPHLELDPLLRAQLARRPLDRGGERVDGPRVDDAIQRNARTARPPSMNATRATIA